MATLLRYLTTGEGSDLVLICNGEIFLVHKTVVAANSPALKTISRDPTVWRPVERAQQY